MKKLALSMLAVALALVFSSVAQSGMLSGEQYAIDSNHYSVVNITEPSAPITMSSHEVVKLDSNGLWVASDYSGVSLNRGMASSGSSSKAASQMYCFDSSSRFCAVAF